MRIVADFKAAQAAGNICPDASSARKGRYGRKSMLSDELRAEYSRIVQSPDVNILYLGLFHSLKCWAAKLKINCKNITELVAKIKHAFATYSTKTLDHIWGHWFACFNEILICDGSNQYKAPHYGGRNLALEQGTSVDRSVNLPHYNRVYAMFHA